MLPPPSLRATRQFRLVQRCCVKFNRGMRARGSSCSRKAAVSWPRSSRMCLTMRIPRRGAEKMHAAGQSNRVVTAACVGNPGTQGVSGACRSSRVPRGARRPHIDAVTSTAVIKGQPIGPRWLPDFVAEHISERLELTQAVDELEALAGRHEDSEEFGKLGLPMSADIAAYMNRQIGNPFQQIQAIYWSVDPRVLRGVLGQVRTARPFQDRSRDQRWPFAGGVM